MIKVSDYIVKVLEKEGIDHIFGIPGVGCGHLVDSLKKSNIKNHIVYHEQGASFMACSYAQSTKNMGAAYVTAGPGATNLITGIANAYVDSIPVLFIVGNKDMDTLKGDLPIRQMASQEIDIVDVARPITKWCCQVKSIDEVRYSLERCIYEAKNGRPGPVLLDISSTFLRMDFDETKGGFVPGEKLESDPALIIDALNASKKPLILAGGGIKQAGLSEDIKYISEKLNIPVVTTVVAFDEFFDHQNYFGFIGVDGDKSANNAVKECDLLITLGARLNIKQLGKKRENFAPNAKIIRVDVDAGELSYRVGKEESINADLTVLVPKLKDRISEISPKELWASRPEFKAVAGGNEFSVEMASALCKKLPEDLNICLGIGSHRRWFLAARDIKKGWKVFQSAGLASMGYALPAAIGAVLADGRPSVSIDGDGGFLMNMQELQMIKREHLPVTIVVFNNHCLGEVMEFQKTVFDKNYFGTTEDTGYLAADQEGIAKAFDLKYTKVTEVSQIEGLDIDFKVPNLIEIMVPDNIEE